MDAMAALRLAAQGVNIQITPFEARAILEALSCYSCAMVCIGNQLSCVEHGRISDEAFALRAEAPR